MFTHKHTTLLEGSNNHQKSVTFMTVNFQP
jgi:hypothetical protein